MKYNRKKQLTLLLTVCLLVISTAGCGSAPATKEAEVRLNLEAPEPITDEAGTDEAEESDANKADASENGAVGTDTDVMAPDADERSTLTEADTETPTQDNPDDTTNTENPSTNSGKWHVYDPDVAAATDADFEGVVHKLETDSFFISPTETTFLKEENALLTVDTATGVEIPDEDLVQVKFDDNTTFILRDIYDGGARHEESDASFRNMEKENFVSLKGSFQNDIFYADSVRINVVH